MTFALIIANALLVVIVFSVIVGMHAWAIRTSVPRRQARLRTRPARASTARGRAYGSPARQV